MLTSTVGSVSTDSGGERYGGADLPVNHGTVATTAATGCRHGACRRPAPNEQDTGTCAGSMLCATANIKIVMPFPHVPDHTPILSARHRDRGGWWCVWCWHTHREEGRGCKAKAMPCRPPAPQQLQPAGPNKCPAHDAGRVPGERLQCWMLPLKAVPYYGALIKVQSRCQQWHRLGKKMCNASGSQPRLAGPNKDTGVALALVVVVSPPRRQHPGARGRRAKRLPYLLLKDPRSFGPCARIASTCRAARCSWRRA